MNKEEISYEILKGYPTNDLIRLSKHYKSVNVDKKHKLCEEIIHRRYCIHRIRQHLLND